MKPVLVQIESQCRATMALLPYVAALPFMNDELLARVFGQTMSMRNWADSMKLSISLPEPTLSELSHRRKPPLTKAEQRAYWRKTQRRYRSTEENNRVAERAFRHRRTNCEPVKELKESEE